MSELRQELPQPIPAAILQLPIERGYPVPWFVAQLADGSYDFRVIRPGGVRAAIARELCWICGEHLGPWVTFVVGPMCAVNRTSAEPPAHRECAEWAAQACPFLARPHARRRETDLPAGAEEPPGIMLRRNPGVALCWHTNRGSFKERPAAPGLFYIGKPHAVTWFAHGRAATREEILASIDSGMPALRERAALQGRRAHKLLDAPPGAQTGAGMTRFAIGDHVLVKDVDHPWSGYTGVIMREFRGVDGLDWIVCLDDSAGHECGAADQALDGMPRRSSDG